MSKLKFSVTIECDENGKLSYWAQQKEAMTPADREHFGQVKEAVRRLIRDKNAEIIHKPPEENAA